MDYLSNIFSYIVEGISRINEGFASVLDFITSSLSDLVFIFSLLKGGLTRITTYFEWLPSSVSTLLVCLFGVVVIYKIVGRD